MVDIARQLRLNAVELLRQPGATRDFEFEVPGDAVSVVHDALDGAIDLRLRLETLNDGIAVSGTIATPWRGVCRRCLVPLSGVDIADVDELYQKIVIDPDAYLIEDGQLDLDPLVRETALLAARRRAAVPARLCRAVPAVRHRPQPGVVRLRRRGPRRTLGGARRSRTRSD